MIGSEMGRKAAEERAREIAYSDTPKPANENLVTFQAEMNEVEKLLGEYNSAGMELNMLKALKRLTALDKRMSQIETTGLPNELASAFNQYRNNMSGLLNHLQNTPYPTELLSEGPQGLSRWVQEQDANIPGFNESFKREMDAWEDEGASYTEKTMITVYRLSTEMQRNNIDFDFSNVTK
jgi:hypothetical protein